MTIPVTGKEWLHTIYKDNKTNMLQTVDRLYIDNDRSDDKSLSADRLMTVLMTDNNVILHVF